MSLAIDWVERAFTLVNPMPGWLRSVAPWTLAFVMSLVLLGGSTAYLAVALVNRTGGDDEGLLPVQMTRGGSAPEGPKDGRIRYSGDLPIDDTSRFLRVPAGEGADLVVSPATAADKDAVSGRYFVPIASPRTAVYDLTRAQLISLMSGAATDWSQVGGLPGAVKVVGPRGADTALVDAWLDGAPVRSGGLETYADIVSAVAADPHAIAMVPLAFVDASVTALGIDGLDVVRGQGDPALWPFRERLTVKVATAKGSDAKASLVEALQASVPPVHTVVLTGDILQSRCTLRKIIGTGDWGAPLRSPLGEYLASADLALGSLDGSIQDIGTPYGCVSTTNLTSPPQTLEALTLAGIDGVTVATNHVFDCGEIYCGNKAFLRTLELLSGAGVAHWGGGRNLEEALQPGIFNLDGVRFGVLGFDDVAAYELEATGTAAGTAPLDDDYTQELAANEPSFYRPASELGIARFLQRIEALEKEVDVVIVQVQSGTEETHKPSPRSLKALRAASAAGADLVVGNQAHWVQAVEYSPSSFTAYALGNFIFDQVWTPEHTEGVLLEATFHETRLVNVRLRPYVIEDQYRPMFVDGARALKILGDIVEASTDLDDQAR